MSVEERQAAKERYLTLLRTVAHNTGGPQPPAARLSSVALTLVNHGSLSREGFRSALQAAIENHDVARLTDPRDGSTERLVLVTEPDLVALIEWLGEMDPTPRGLIAAANQELQEVRDD
jgi:hypothetical protein